MSGRIWAYALVAIAVAAGPVLGGPSLEIRKPPVVPPASWTGPGSDPHALQGQWFLRQDGTEEVRTHEFYDETAGDPSVGYTAIQGIAQNVVQDSAGNVVSFELVVSITNNVPWGTDWRDGSNSHGETLATTAQYNGTLWSTKFVAEFAIDAAAGPPPLNAYPPYSEFTPHIVAVNPEQLAWYCWTPDNPDPTLKPWGNYSVPTWDFGNIPKGATKTRVLKFTVDGGGLPLSDWRNSAIRASASMGFDLLCNRTLSLKISTWIDWILVDPAIPGQDDNPYRMSDCSVFHNALPNMDDVGGLSLAITKPPVVPVPSWTGPVIDSHAIRGQWFINSDGMEEVRSHEYYDPVFEYEGLLLGSGAIFGTATNVVTNASGAITSFDLVVTITNHTPWPWDWPPGSNSHGETLQTDEQYVGTLWDTKFTAEFAVDMAAGLPPGPTLPYRETDPYIEAVAPDQWAWYCWTPGNDDPEKQPTGNYYVPTYDFGDIAPGASVTRTVSFTVPNGLPQADPRHGAIMASAANGTDVLANRPTSLKISTWVDDIAADPGSVVFPEPPLRMSDCSVFHNTRPDIGGLSLAVTKPPVTPIPSWTGPMADPDAKQGQWFLNPDGTEEVRTNEYYDETVILDGGTAAGWDAIEGWATSVIQDPQGNITSFDLVVTIRNRTPWPWDWFNGTNSHDESLQMTDQYEGTLWQTKFTADFAVDPAIGYPPAGATVYRTTTPFIEAVAPDQWAWYCWTPGNTDPNRQPPGSYYVPCWDFGDIPQGTFVTRTLSFVVPGGLPSSDARHAAILNSASTGADLLSNRSASLKISTWVDEIALDTGSVSVGPPPLRMSDCSVFHNTEPPMPEFGGLSLDIRKLPVIPVPSWTGPMKDPHAELGQWFQPKDGTDIQCRTHEFYDNVADWGGALWGSQAIFGHAANVVQDSAGNIVSFDVVATVTNLTPWPYDWLNGSNSHNESLATPDQYAGTLWATKLTAEFAVDPALLPGGVPPYIDYIPHIVAVNHEQLGWYCWTPENPEEALVPWGSFQVPTWDFGDIPQGASATRTMSFIVDGGGLPITDPRHAVILGSASNVTDVLANRSTSLKISTWLDQLAFDLGVAYPHLEGYDPLRSSNCSVFHNNGQPITLTAVVDWGWVYQNSATAGAWNHKCTLTIGIAADPNGNPPGTYQITVTENPSLSQGHVVIVPTANPLVFDLFGGTHNVDPFGPVTLNIDVRGTVNGGQGFATMMVVVHPFGDINKDNAVTTADAVELTKRLNGLPTGSLGLRDFDLDNNGSVTTGDSVLLTKRLNNLPLP